MIDSEVLAAGFSLGVANFMFIGLKAMQQRNVQYLKYGRTFIMSHLLALVEIYVIFIVADKGVSLGTVVPIGTGGGLGAVAAMWLTRGYHAKSRR